MDDWTVELYWDEFIAANLFAANLFASNLFAANLFAANLFAANLLVVLEIKSVYKWHIIHTSRTTYRLSSGVRVCSLCYTSPVFTIVEK